MVATNKDLSAAPLSARRTQTDVGNLSLKSLLFPIDQPIDQKTEPASDGIPSLKSLIFLTTQSSVKKTVLTNMPDLAGRTILLG